MAAGERLRRLRQSAGYTQAELAQAAGVSRTLISAVEAGRHLPRVDAALALASALGTSAEALFATSAPEIVDALTGQPPPAGTAIRLGVVGGRPVSAMPRPSGDGWQVVDGVVGDLDSTLQDRKSVVIAGCEPGLIVMERLLRDHGTRALAIGASSAASLAALVAGRLHGAVVHFAEGQVPEGRGVTRIHLARWRVGLAARAGSQRGWWRAALAGRRPVVQREVGAAAQEAFRRAASPEETVDGPIAGSHLDACRQGVNSGLAAVTIEPAAAAVGADFHALETHEVELWLADEHRDEPGVRRLLDLLADRALRRTLESVGGYDLSRLGSRAA